MKKFLFILFLISCAGCVSVKIPRYLEDSSTYLKKFYAPFEETFAATQKTLQEQGWVISDTVDPAIYEQMANYDSKRGKQTLIFTETRQTSLLLFSRYTNLNVYVRSLDSSSTEVEIRYHSVTPLFFKSLKSTKNDHFVDKLFELIAKSLEK